MSLKIIKAGILDTIQDQGRYGYQHLGINPTGAMDRYSAQLANALLGKDLNAPVLEFHFPGPVILFEEDTIISITGGNFSPVIDDEACDMNAVVMVNKNSLMKFNRMIDGARCYMSTIPPLKIERWLDSYSTHLKARVGGWKGGALMAGDQLTFEQTINYDVFNLPFQSPLRSDTSAKELIHVLPGAAWENLAEASKNVFLNDFFMITRFADRMGYRLSGSPLGINGIKELLSTAVTFGTIQRFPDGQLVILMADHQTTGGYPQIAHVISADLSVLAQKQPGDKIRFVFTDIENAESKLKEQLNYLLQIEKESKSNMEKLYNAKG